MDNNNFNPGQFGGAPNFMAAPSYAPRYPYGGYNQPQVTTNVELVTSLEEALFKSNTRNSDMYYHDQNKPLFYRIRVDMNGAKSYAVLPYTLPNQPENAPATKADIQALDIRLAALEAGKPVPKKKKTEVEDNESNG